MSTEASSEPGVLPAYRLSELVTYALKLRTEGFGGPVAPVGYMHRDLVERRKLKLKKTPGAGAHRSRSILGYRVVSNSAVVVASARFSANDLQS